MITSGIYKQFNGFLCDNNEFYLKWQMRVKVNYIGNNIKILCNSHENSYTVVNINSYFKHEFLVS